ncbi:ribonucleoside triphosphate reductase, partial [bacterium]|nr:ribonucleoside triphosphate reductase [bacterium]
AYVSVNEEEFFQKLDKMMDISARSLKVKREIITKLLKEGLYPYTKRYLGTFNNHFSTIGVIGINEAALNAKWIGEDLTHKKAQEFAKRILNHMREKLVDYQEKYGDLYNLEATPAESTTYRLAKHDRKRYPDIITASEKDKTPYYTNSSHLPVGYTSDIFDALEIQDELQTLYTSGTVFHAFLGEKLPDWQATAKLVKKIAENFKLPYYTMSPTYSICKEHGYIVGEHFKCPTCGEDAEVYSRITGYYRPVQNWNDGKLQEYAERKLYDIPNSKLKAEKQFTKEEACASKKEEGDKVLMFTTKTCPNCRMAKDFLDKANIRYEIIDAEENEALAIKYRIMQAPTLVVMKNEGAEKYVNLVNIKKFISAQ